MRGAVGIVPLSLFFFLCRDLDEQSLEYRLAILSAWAGGDQDIQGLAKEVPLSHPFGLIPKRGWAAASGAERGAGPAVAGAGPVTAK